MRILFVHQNFPGQFGRLAAALARSAKNSVVAMGNRDNVQIPGVTYVAYRPRRSPPLTVFPAIQHLGNEVRQGLAARFAYENLKQKGFDPEVIIAHPGWGEALMLREVWPTAKIISYMEYYYSSTNSDTDFDKSITKSEVARQSTNLRNATSLFAFADSDRCVTPTNWQASLFPLPLRQNLMVLHEGIDTRRARPNAKATLQLPNGIALSRKDEVLTYVSRSLEPYRGFHVFLRMLPELLRRRPQLQVVIVGKEKPSYGQAPSGFASWRQKLLDEVDRSDFDRVHFMNTVPYAVFLNVLQISRVHTYLTYPFVLSWSLLEAMSCGCSIIGSKTGPVEEVITHDETGRLVDFFDLPGLADAIDELLDAPDARRRLGTSARQFVEKYDFISKSLPAYKQLIAEVVSSRR